MNELEIYLERMDVTALLILCTDSAIGITFI